MPVTSLLQVNVRGPKEEMASPENPVGGPGHELAIGRRGQETPVGAESVGLFQNRTRASPGVSCGQHPAEGWPRSLPTP